MRHTMDTIRQKFHDRECKLTPQRQKILKVFMDNPESHLSAEDVYSIIKQKHPEIGLATIYRTLDLLAEMEVLQRMDFGDGRSRYEFTQNEAHHHHHLICTRCGAVTEFADDLLEALEDAIARRSGFEVIDHQLKFFGYCKKCR
ncbi:MAG: Fur family transcriptional regulator [Bacillota bacterium]